MAKVNPAQLEKNLNEVDYPISKKDLIKHAELKGFDEVVLRTLKQLPSKQYETIVDLNIAIDNIQ